MSKLWKGIKKVFKKIVKVIKKVVPIVLAVAAIYFTAGAALGITGAAGWSGVAQTIGAKLGTGVLASTVTGAITQAGIGAAVGGVVSKAMGGSFTQGAQRGAAIGAVTGGFTGFRNFAPPAGGATTFPMPETPQLGGTQLDAAGNPVLGPQQYPPSGGTPLPVGPPVPTGGEAAAMNTAGGLTQPSITAPVVDKVASTVGSGAGEVVGEAGKELVKKPTFFAEGGWLERNQTIAGGAVSGLGQGIMAMAGADSDRDFLREKFALTAANYEGTDPGRNFRSLAGSEERQDRYDPRSYGSWEYQYDPVQGRIIKVPAGGQGG